MRLSLGPLLPLLLPLLRTARPSIPAPSAAAAPDAAADASAAPEAEEAACLRSYSFDHQRRRSKQALDHRVSPGRADWCMKLFSHNRKRKAVSQ